MPSCWDCCCCRFGFHAENLLLILPWRSQNTQLQLWFLKTAVMSSLRTRRTSFPVQEPTFMAPELALALTELLNRLRWKVPAWRKVVPIRHDRLDGADFYLRCTDASFICFLIQTDTPLRTFFSVCGVNSSQFGSAVLKLCVDLVLVALDFICRRLNIRVKPPVPTPGSIIFYATQNRRHAAAVLMSLKRWCTIHAGKTNYTSFVSFWSQSVPLYPLNYICHNYNTLCEYCNIICGWLHVVLKLNQRQKTGSRFLSVYRPHPTLLCFQSRSTKTTKVSPNFSSQKLECETPKNWIHFAK